jgi:hypothetical protein
MKATWIRVARGLAILGVAGAAFVVYQRQLRRDDAMSASVRELKDAVETLQGASAPSRDVSRALVERLREVAATPPPAPPAPAEAPPPPERAAPDPEADKLQRLIVADRLAQHFEAEARDASWGESEGRDLRRALDALETAKDKVERIECHSTLCKLEGRFETKQTFSELMKKTFVGSDASIAHGGVMAPVVEVGDDGQVHAEVYMARAGASLPSLN